MTRSEIISSIALMVSFASFGISLFSSFRDRAHLVMTSKFLPGWEESSAYVSVIVVNTGRRPTILRIWVGAESKNNWVGTYFGGKTDGLRLGEHERHEFKLYKHELLESTPYGDVAIQDLWIEDTLGRRHIVKGAKENLAKLWAV